MKIFLAFIFVFFFGAAPAFAEYPPVPESTNTVPPTLQPSVVQTLPNTGANIDNIFVLAALVLTIGVVFIWVANRKSR